MQVHSEGVHADDFIWLGADDRSHQIACAIFDRKPLPIAHKVACGWCSRQHNEVLNWTTCQKRYSVRPANVGKVLPSTARLSHESRCASTSARTCSDVVNLEQT
eukprot:COSAG02_NODE_43931_length_370_cov_0.940959_1_plen_103_part_01